VKKYERAKRGVSVLINKKWKGFKKNWEFIDERILKLDMNRTCYNVKINVHIFIIATIICPFQMDCITFFSTSVFRSLHLLEVGKVYRIKAMKNDEKDSVCHALRTD
jgi:hypothetical protein